MTIIESSYLTGLNPKQRFAVELRDGPLLVLAGAGTGKTRVVTSRIAHLISSGIPACNILAITFTKKAAEEMKERTQLMLSGESDGLMVCTFHALGYRILCEQQVRVDTNGRLRLISPTKQRDLVTSVLDCVDSERQFTVGEAIRLISCMKNEVGTKSGCRDDSSATCQGILDEYERRLIERQNIDFDDLLLIPRDLLRESPQLRDYYRQRWTHILVDEYQDTNGVQHDLMKQLVGLEQNVCVVGDDDQSIYGFRGANADRILSFRAEFPGTRHVTLDESYRSHSEIVDVANDVISLASQRYTKTLRSMHGRGGKVVVTTANSAEAESMSIADEIERRRRDRSLPWSDIAVLYRVQSDGDILRETLAARDIPHRSQTGTSTSDDGVTIMTLHRSKGLEFPIVFLPAIEEDTLPHFHAIRSGQSGIDEERRLLYVGVTRARRELLLSSSLKRRGIPRQASRFLSELTRV